MAGLYDLFYLHYAIANVKPSVPSQRSTRCVEMLSLPTSVYLFCVVVYVEEFTLCWHSCLQNLPSLFHSGVLNFLAWALRWNLHLDISQFVLLCKYLFVIRQFRRLITLYRIKSYSRASTCVFLYTAQHFRNKKDL